MKLSNPLSSMQSGYKSRLLSYPMLFVLATLEFLYFATIDGPNYSVDTYTYINAADNVLGGSPDIVRTPIYPLVIGLFRGCFGAEYWPMALCIVQFGVLLLTAVYMYKIANRFIAKRKIQFWLIAAFLLLPGIVFFTVRLITEIFTVACVVFLCWVLVKNLPGPYKSRDVIEATLWLAILIFLRPICIILIPILLLYYLLMIPRLGKKRLGTIILSFVGVLLVMAMLACYKEAVHNKYGIESLTNVTTCNNYCALRYGGIIDPSLTQDPLLKQLLTETLSTKNQGHKYGLVITEYYKIEKQINDAVFEQYVNKAMATYPSAFIKGLIIRWTVEVKDCEMVPISGPFPISMICAILIPNMNTYLLFLLIFTIMTVVAWYRTHRTPMESVLFLCICIGLYLATVAGAQSEYSRLNLPALPLAFILIGKFCSLFHRNPRAYIN